MMVGDMVRDARTGLRYSELADVVIISVKKFPHWKNMTLEVKGVNDIFSRRTLVINEQALDC